MIQFGCIEYDLVVFTFQSPFQSPHNLWLIDLLNYAAICGIMFFLGSGETCTGRGGSRAAATSKMEPFVIIVNGFQPLTIIKKRSIFDVAAVLDPPLTWNMEINRKGKEHGNWQKSEIWRIAEIKGRSENFHF